ncbi:uncharacterized protein G2W53_036745 [Senna tora]|uniref:Uncharacterized protein n=1 Tax=Senna tora TaxID=362788 RepID=A0A834SXZ2_9FABA|nr:uncharacterized protein G2W53_036745 [Senna tora]
MDHHLASAARYLILGPQSTDFHKNLA